MSNRSKVTDDGRWRTRLFLNDVSDCPVVQIQR